MITKLNVHSGPFKFRRHDAAARALIEAGESAIARKGYERVTMRDIAAEAGCTPGTLYLYFKNKREMLAAVLLRHHRFLYPQLVKALAASTDPREILRAITRTWVEHFNRNRNFCKLVFSARPGSPEALMDELPPDARRNWEEVRLAELDAIRHGQRRGQIRRDFKAEEIQRFIHGLTAGFLAEMSLQEPLPDPELQLRMLWGFLTGGVAGAGSEDPG